MWRWSIWRFWLSHIRNYTTMGRYSVGERQMTITFHAGRHSGSIDSESEHDDYWLWLTRKMEDSDNHSDRKIVWINTRKINRTFWMFSQDGESGVIFGDDRGGRRLVEHWCDLRWWPRRSTSGCVWENLEIPGTRGEVFWTWNTSWMMNYCLGESDLEGGSAGKCFLYCEFGFVYKVIHIPSRTVAGVVLREHDNR